jgi:hypothetical protein
VPDSKVGEEICVYLRLRDGVTINEQDVLDYCKDKVSVHFYKISSIYIFQSKHKNCENKTRMKIFLSSEM